MSVRLKELRNLLLPKKFSPTGSYNQPERISARAVSYRVLAHAEFETYFEDRAVEIARTALDAWEKRGHVSTVAMHLLGFAGMEMGRPPSTLQSKNHNQSRWEREKLTLIDRFSRSVSTYTHDVRNKNHGIKEENVLRMLLPIGFDHKKCDSLLITNLNQFGTRRGLIAHSSRQSYVSVFVNPKDEFDTVSQLISSLKAVDNELDRLLEAASQ